MMRGQAARVLLLVGLLSFLAADVSIGCGKGAYVFGPVEQKYAAGTDEIDPTVLIAGQTYQVPRYFFNQISVGDTVKFNGRQWSIVKKSDGTVPAQPAP